MVAEAGIPMTSTLGFGVPVFGVYADDNVPRFRDGRPWPDSVPRGGMIRPAGEKAVNARYLWDAGVTMGFGTDTGFHPKDSIAHELRPLHLVFSAEDIVKMLTINAAAFLELDDEIGTLEVGKQADIVILGRDPIRRDYWPTQTEFPF
jgi:imidazolonepropionase-like amidohydrolase